MRSRFDSIEADHDRISSAKELTFVAGRLLLWASLMPDVVRRTTLKADI
jgi:hypothetical protein